MAETIELVTRAQFAQMQGVSRKTVTMWVQRGRIQIARKVGGRELIDPVAARLALKSSEQRAEEAGRLLDDGDDAPEQQQAHKVSSLTDEKRETERERRMLLQIQRLEKQGQLISRMQVDAEQETAARLVKKALDAMPSKAEDIFAAAQEGGVLAVRKALRQMVRDTQDAMSRALLTAAEELEAQRAAEEDDAAA